MILKWSRRFQLNCKPTFRFFKKQWCHFITNKDCSESIFNFYRDYDTQMTCSLKHPCDVKFSISNDFFFTTLYKNLINESFFMNFFLKIAMKQISIYESAKK